MLKSVCALLLFVAALPVSGCNKAQDSSEGKPAPAGVTSAVVPGPSVAAVSRKLAVVSEAFLAAEKERVAQGSHESAIELAPQGTGVAYIEPFEGKLRVVHNGRAGKAYPEILDLRISSDGRHVAYVVRDPKRGATLVVDGEERHPYGENDSHGFSPDGRHHLSTVSRGEVRRLIIDGKEYAEYNLAASPLVNPDSRSVAFSARNAGGGTRFIVADLGLQDRTVLDSCGEHYAASDDRSHLAVVCSEGKMGSVKVVDFQSRKVVSDSRFDGTMTRMKFAGDNRSLIYTLLTPKGDRYLGYGDKKEKTPAGDEFFTDPLVLSDPASVGVAIGTVYKAYLYHAFQKQPRSEKRYGYISDLVSSKDGRHHAYMAVKVNGQRQQIVVDGHEGPLFDKVVGPVFSPDGRVLVYRARDAGRRFVVVSDLSGKVLRQLAPYQMVFQPSFNAEGTSIGYGVLDRNELWWKVDKL